MPQVKLEVYDASSESVFTYSGSELEQSTPTYQQQGDSDTIEGGTVTLRLNSDSFIGIILPEELPDGPYRCRLTYVYNNGSEVEFLNGRIRRSDITYYPDVITWSIRCIDDSGDRFQELIEGVNFNDGGLTIDTLTVETSVVASDGGVDTANHDWFSLESAWDEIIAATEFIYLSYQEVRQFFWFDVEYDDSGTDRTISRNFPFYVTYQEAGDEKPEWNGGQVFDVLQKILGWRVRTSFEPFPSPYIAATIVTDLFNQPILPVPEMDTRARLDEIPGITHLDAEKEDFGIQYQNGVNEEDLAADTTAQQALAVYSAFTSKLSAEGKGRNRSIQTVPLYMVQIDEQVGNSGTLLAYQPDAADNPNYTEDVNWSVPVVLGRDRVYVASFQDISGDERAVIYRAPNDPATGQLGQVAETWASTLINNFQTSISTLLQFIGKFDFEDIPSVPVVGDPNTGVSYRGFNWMLQEFKWDLPLNEGDLTAIRPLVTPVVDIDLPVICPPTNVTMTQTLVSETPDFRIEWEAPDPACGQQVPVSYEVWVGQPGSSPVLEATVSALVYNTGVLGPGGYGEYVVAVRSNASSGDKSIFAGSAAINVDPDDE